MKKSVMSNVAVIAALAVALLSCNENYPTVNNPNGPSVSFGGPNNPNPNPTPTSYLLTVNRSPAAGGTVSVDGTTRLTSGNSTTSWSNTYSSGTSVQVCATASSGYIFTGWSGSSTSTSICVTMSMTASRTLTANFQQRVTNYYTLTVNRSPAAGGTVSVGGATRLTSGNSTTSWSNTYSSGTSVQACATANSGYNFTGWSGAFTSNSSCVTITMTAARTLTANFRTIRTIYGTFTDTRDGQTYKTVVIGSKTWMAENLNYNVADGTGSWCYWNDASNCDTYGRLYDWNTAMAGASSSSVYSSAVDLDEDVLLFLGMILSPTY